MQDLLKDIPCHFSVDPAVNPMSATPDDVAQPTDDQEHQHVCFEALFVSVL